MPRGLFVSCVREAVRSCSTPYGVLRIYYSITTWRGSLLVFRAWAVCTGTDNAREPQRTRRTFRGEPDLRTDWRSVLPILAYGILRALIADVGAPGLVQCSVYLSSGYLISLSAYGVRSTPCSVELMQTHKHS